LYKIDLTKHALNIQRNIFLKFNSPVDLYTFVEEYCYIVCKIESRTELTFFNRQKNKIK